MKHWVELEGGDLVVEFDSDFEITEAQEYRERFMQFSDCTHLVKNSEFWRNKAVEALQHKLQIKKFEERWNSAKEVI